MRRLSYSTRATPVSPSSAKATGIDRAKAIVDRFLTDDDDAFLAKHGALGERVLAPAADDTNGDFAQYQVPVVWSKMLTVWRKLHVETDTMVRPTFVQNTYTMNWRNPVQDASPDRVVIEVEDTLGGFATPTGQFDEGWVSISGPPGTAFGRVFEYQSSAGWDEVVLIVAATNGIGGQKGLAGLGGLTSGVATMSDDDLGEETTFQATLWGC